MINYLNKALGVPFKRVNALRLLIAWPIHAPEGARRLDLYKKIKSQNMKSITNNPLHPESVHRYYQQHRCDGCNSVLQSDDIHKYGYINAEALARSVKNNIRVIENSYGQKVSSNDSKILQIIHDVQKQLGVSIFNNETRKLDNLDHVPTLLRLQEKIDKYEEEEQTIKRIRKDRLELYCQRCYSLKYHNKLPDEFDLPDQHEDYELLMNKVLSKHHKTPTHFIYLVDVLDIAGTLKKYIFDRLMDAGIDFSIAINKFDIVNQEYLNKHKILQEVRNLLQEFIADRQQSQKLDLQARIDKIRIVLVSSVDREGMKILQNYLQKNLIYRIQLVGLPSTGKTTMLNQLARTHKPTSKVPGTTLYISQHRYKKSIIYDMPGMYFQENLINKISKPNQKTLLTWNKFYSPPVLLHQAFFYGGKVEIKNVKIIPFGMGGVCASDNRWFVLNHRIFWKGLPPPHELKIQKHTIQLHFKDGKAEDLQIAGWGFIAFRSAIGSKQSHTRQLTLYLPQGIHFHLRESVLTDSRIFSYKSVVKKRYRLERVHEQKRKMLSESDKK